MATKQNKPITEKQVATFTKLIESGMLEHLEDTERWEVVDTVWEFLRNFASLKEDEVYTSPTSAATFFTDLEKHRDLVRAVCRIVNKQWNDSIEELEILELVAKEFDIPEYVQDPDEQDKKFERDLETLLEQDTNYQNRVRLQDMLRLSHHADTETILEEVRSRII